MVRLSSNVTFLRLGVRIVDDEYDTNFCSVGVAERTGTKDPYAWCLSGRLLRPEVELDLLISNMDASEAPDDVESMDDVRARGRGCAEVIVIYVSFIKISLVSANVVYQENSGLTIVVDMDEAVSTPSEGIPGILLRWMGLYSLLDCNFLYLASEYCHPSWQDL